MRLTRHHSIPGGRPTRLTLVLLMALCLGGAANFDLRQASAADVAQSVSPAAASVAPGARKGPPKCRLSPRGIPQCRPLVGASHGSNTEPVGLEQMAGRSLAVRRTYYTAGQVDSAISTAAGDIAQGRLPWISFKLPYSWEDMAAGRGDAWARNIARRLSALPGQVWIAFHHEPEGDGNLAAWRRTQERLAPLVRRAAHNVAYSVVLTGWDQLYGDPAYHFDQIWPRGVKIDIAGFDLYNEYGVTKNGKYDDRWPCMRCLYYTPIAQWAAAHDVAWGIAEFGWTDAAAEVHPHWLHQTYRTARKAGAVAFTYFDTPYNSIASWDLTSYDKQKLFTDLAKRSPVPQLRH